MGSNPTTPTNFMKVLITGHRLEKLYNYDVAWIDRKLWEVMTDLQERHGFARGYSGMASGVDLWFAQWCVAKKIPFVACIPFEGQELQMNEPNRNLRKLLIESAAEVRNVKNSWMVEQCDMGIVVWDGNKGGTHNVVQQLVERKKGFWWMNPVSKVVYDCTQTCA